MSQNQQENRRSAKIYWKNGFEAWNLYRLATPMDGSCLFHAIISAYFEPYNTEQINGKFVSRNTIIKSLRKDLSNKLGTFIPEIPDKRYYDLLRNGHVAQFALEVKDPDYDFSLENMQHVLNSNSFVGYGYLEFIADSLNKDIYILEEYRDSSVTRQDLYVMDDLPFIVKGDRPSIVLYFHNHHYETVGIQLPDGTYATHFSPHHSFIKFLYSKVQDIISRATPHSIES